MSAGPSVRGLAFNGVVLMHLLHKCDITHIHTWHHLMMLEVISIWHAGYHYHAATYLTTQIAQTDGHAAMIGYALDGYGMYQHLSTTGTEYNRS
jgi:hypothetical protein